MFKLIAITFLTMFALSFSAQAHCGKDGCPLKKGAHSESAHGHKHKAKKHACCMEAKKKGEKCGSCDLKKKAKKAKKAA